MADSSRETLRKALERQVARLDKKINVLERWDSRFSIYRLVTFLSGIVAVSLAIYFNYSILAILLLVLFISGFVTLVYYHRKFDRTVEKFRRWKNIRSVHLARMKLKWDQIPEREVDVDNDHPYARDFNITGRHSLLQLLDTSIYRGGTETLAGWLLDNNPDHEKIKHRQTLVKELKPMAHFRDRVRLIGEMTKSSKSPYDWDMQTLIRWLELSKKKKFIAGLIILGALAGINIILGILFLAGFIAPYVIISFFVYLTVYNFHSNKFEGLFDDAYQIEKLLSRFSSILLYLETYPYKENSELESFCRMYHEAETSPSVYLKKIIRISMAASSQKSELIWLLLNSLVPWDLYFAWRLNAYKSELREKLVMWQARFNELEALCSLANYAWINPGYIFSVPVRDDTAIAFRAEELGHPLINHKKRVTNSITINEKGTLLLITGSNMAGKSTFLRTLGINLCLCFAGAPVCAGQFHTIPFRLFSSINVTDSLDEGLSHFYAEVRKLRILLEELDRPSSYPLFFFVDEIFRGTNNRERLAGSTAFLKKVAGKNGIGAISTHDLELAQLENEIPQLYNYHFEETIEDGKMRFEYKLKPGPCPTTNALKIMEMEGLPVD